MCGGIEPSKDDLYIAVDEEPFDTSTFVSETADESK
jgi:hypothetical protein